MGFPTEVQRSGLEYLGTVSELLDRIRSEHPTHGLFETAEVLWWWAQNERRTDDYGQLFWLGDDGRPIAAVIATQFGDVIQLDPLFLPGAPADWTAHVMARGCEHAASHGYGEAVLEVDRADHALRSILDRLGFVVDEDGLVDCWMAADERPQVAVAPVGYELSDRAESADRPHHMISQRRGHRDPTPRLRQTPLYRPKLDLCVYDPSGNIAGYGLFWYNPTTRVGVVEPMRTEDEYQQRGIARLILTTGLDRLVQAGATRLKVAFEPGNAAAKSLYLACGFQPHRNNDLYAGPTTG